MATEISRLRTISRLNLSLSRSATPRSRSASCSTPWPDPAPSAPAGGRPRRAGQPWLASVLVTLLDHEASLPSSRSTARDALEQFVRQRMAVTPAAVEHADFVVASSERLDPSLPLRLRQGTLAYPNDSATLLLLVPTLDQAADSNSASASRLALAGPGVTGRPSCPSRRPRSRPVRGP